MIELTPTQLAVLATARESPPRVVNPLTQERFVLVHEAVYEELTKDLSDDSPWTDEELDALAEEAGNLLDKYEP